MPALPDSASAEPAQFVWETQPLAARWVKRSVAALSARNPIIEKLAYELREFTGTRLVDWIDHLAISDDNSLGLVGDLPDVGYRVTSESGQSVWRHSLGMFPPVIVSGGRTGIAIRCDSVE